MAVGRNGGRGVWKRKSDTASSSPETSLVAGEDLLAGSIVYVDSSGQFLKAQADAVPQAFAYGMLQTSALSGLTAGALTDGVVDLADWTAIAGAAALVPGTNYFLDALLPGRMSTSAPSTGTAHLVTFVGTALSTTKFHFEREYILRRA